MPEVSCAYDVILMTKRIENLREQLLKWNETFEGKGPKINIKKTKVMMSGWKNEVHKSYISQPMCQVRREGDGKFM